MNAKAFRYMEQTSEVVVASNPGIVSKPAAAPIAKAPVSTLVTTEPLPIAKAPVSTLVTTEPLPIAKAPVSTLVTTEPLPIAKVLEPVSTVVVKEIELVSKVVTKLPVAVSTIVAKEIEPVATVVVKALEPVSTVVFGAPIAAAPVTVSTLFTTAPPAPVLKTEPDWKRKMREKNEAEAARKAAEEAVKKANIAYLYKK